MLKQCERSKITHRDVANNIYFYYSTTCKHVWNMIIYVMIKSLSFGGKLVTYKWQDYIRPQNPP